MKILISCLFLTTACIQAAPNPGDSVADQSFSLSPSTSGNTLNNLTNASLSDYDGKVILLAYFTPW